MTSSKQHGPRQVPPPQGGAPRPANAYARFIPREELAEFASWTPDAFAGLGDAGGLNPAAAARAAAAQRQAGAEPPAVVTEAEWLRRIQDARQQGWHDGHRDGLQALEAAKRQHAMQVSAQIAPLVAGLDEQLRALEQEMAQAVAETAVTLARQVVRSEITQHPDCVLRVAQDALAAVMLSARHLRLHLHPDDLPLVEAGAGEALRARQVLLLSDPALQRGGCRVESDLGQVDASMACRWAQAAAAFGSECAWTDGDAAADGAAEAANGAAA